MKELKISKEISLPLDAVTQTLATIGRKGAGKTYLATMIAEQMLDNEAQVIVMDPVGNWWGLRVDADGKSKGKEIFVIGGDHGDVPLVPEAGARIAQLLVEKNISAILDVSSFRLGEHKRFAAEFAEEFFHLKKSHRSPVHIFIEEAQRLIPQRVGPDEARMVGAFEQIVRLGRNYGIGCTLVTQRPQSVNKEVLSQVECLCVLQVTGPHERKALEDWVQEVGADRKLIKELPGLARGEGYVWSPSWLRIYKRVNFSTKQTFDASATPEVGKKTKAASISAVDVEALKQDMADVVAQVEKDNPTLLRRKIVELEKQLKTKSPALSVAMGVSQWLEYGKKHGYDKFFIEKEAEKILKVREEYFKKFHVNLVKEITPAKKIIDSVFNLLSEQISQDVHPVYKSDYAKPMPDNNKVDIFKNTYAHIPKTMPPGVITTPMYIIPELKAGARKMLHMLIVRHPDRLTKSQLGTLVGFKATGGTFGAYISTLKSAELITDINGTLGVTEKGLEYPLEEEVPQTPEERQAMWKGRLKLGARKMFDVILETYPGSITKENLGEAVGNIHTGGTFGAYLSTMKSAGLIEVVGQDIRASDNLFN